MSFKKIYCKVFIVFVYFLLSACTKVPMELIVKQSKSVTKPLDAKLDSITLIYPVLRKVDLNSLTPFEIEEEDDDDDEWKTDESQKNQSVLVRSSLVPLKQVGGVDIDLFVTNYIGAENNFRIKDVFEEALNYSLVQSHIFNDSSNNELSLRVRLINADSTFVRWSGHTKSYVFRYALLDKNGKVVYQSDIASKNSEENPYSHGSNILLENVRTALRNNISKFIEDLARNGFNRPSKAASKNNYKYLTCDETWGALKLKMSIQEVSSILGSEILRSYNETKKLKYDLGLGVLLFDENGILEDYGIRTCLDFITYDETPY